MIMDKKILVRIPVSHTLVCGKNNKPKIMSVLNSKQNYNWQSMMSLNTTKWIWQQDPILLHIYVSDFIYLPQILLN